MENNEQEQKMIEELKMLVKLFLKTNASDIELSEFEGVSLSSSTIGRRLTNKDLFLKAYPFGGLDLYQEVQKRRQANLYKGKVIGGQSSQLNNANLRDEEGKIKSSTKLRLDVFYKDEESQMKILKHMALTFRVKLPTLAMLLRMDEEALLNKLITYNNLSYDSLKFLFNHDYTDQDLAREALVDFYRKYLNSLRFRDKNERDRLMESISDVKAQKFIDKHKPGDQLRPEDIATILNYQLKYATSLLAIERIFRVDRENYKDRVIEFTADKPELYSRFEYLIDYYTNRGKNGKRHG